MWKTERPDPVPIRSTADTGKISLLVEPTDNRQWQHIMVALGKHSDDLHRECLQTWPREAIRLVRQELDRFEAELEGQGDLP